MLTSDTTSQQMATLLTGATDVGIVVPPLHDAGDFRVINFCDQELMLAVPVAHPLANQKRVQLRDLSQESFVGFPFSQGPGFESVVMAACHDCGFVPKFVQVAAEMQTILALVSSGLGIALVPQAMQVVQTEHVVYLQVRRGKAAVKYSLGLAFNPANTNPVVNAFAAIAQRLSRH